MSDIDKSNVKQAISIALDEHRSLQDRLLAVETLLLIGGEQAQETLVTLMRSSNLVMVWHASMAFPKLRSNLRTSTKASLLSLLKAGRSENHRRAAAVALGSLRSEGATQALIAVLRDRSEPDQLRAEVAEVLGRFDHPDAALALVDALRDPIPWVRLFAANSLATIGGAADVPELTKLLNDHSEVLPFGRVSDEARYAIRSIRSRD